MAFNPSSAQASAESPSTKSSSELIDSKSPNLVDAPFPVVGVAASAGGLEAFKQLLSYLPIDTGMAFVLIQHLAPDHEASWLKF